jgi:uncharacterized protein (DUF1684 family)
LTIILRPVVLADEKFNVTVGKTMYFAPQILDFNFNVSPIQAVSLSVTCLIPPPFSDRD